MAMFYASRALQCAFRMLTSVSAMSLGATRRAASSVSTTTWRSKNHPPSAVRPDAGWPCVFAEKGIGNLLIGRKLLSGKLTLLSLEGGERPGIVVERAE